MAEPKRRAAILLPNLGGGGAERVALAIAADLIERGHEVDLLLVEARGQLLPLVPAGARIVDLKAHRLRAALRPLIRYLRQAAPDVLNAHMWPLTVVAIMAHRLARSRARLVIMDHTALSRHEPAGKARRLLKWTTRLFYPLADERIIVSKAAAADLARLSGITPDRIAVVYSPVRTPATLAGGAEAETAWRGPGPRILGVGSLNKVKNHALLLDAFARLQRRDARLVILGEGELRADLERQAEALGIAARVSLPGFAIDPWPYFASADLFVLSSDYEGFGIVLAEAMYSGLRIVSTDCGGSREILDDGRFGRLVPCGDAEAMAAAIDETLTHPTGPTRTKARAEAMFESSRRHLRELLLGRG
jgi:glycosyltransferase involved in cell wall biosynthesis